MTRRILRCLVAATSVVVVSAGLLTTGLADASARPAVPVRATTIHPVIAPTFLQPGLVHLKNTGSDDLVLFRRATKAGVRTLVKAMNAHELSGPQIVRVDRKFPILDVINAKSDVYVRLTDGTYYLVDAAAERYHRSDVHVIHVEGVRADAKRPAAHALTLSPQRGLRGPQRVRGGHFLYVRNLTHQLQGFLIIRLSSSATSAQIQKFLAKPSFDQLFPLMAHSINALSELAVMSGQHKAYVRFPGGAARYIVVASAIPGGDLSLSRSTVALITAH